MAESPPATISDGRRTTLRRAVWLVAAWTAFGCVQTIAWLSSPMPKRDTVASRLLFDILLAWSWAALTPVVVWIARYRVTGRWAGARTVLLHIVMAVTVALAFSVLRVVYDGLIMHGTLRSVWLAFIGWADLNAILYLLIVGVVRAFDQLHEYRDRTLRAAALETQLSGAQLRFLERQLQPHFLFNCLHAISELAHEAPASARRILGQLQSLLRSAVSKAGRDEVAVGEELDTLEPYVDIQRARFSEWLTVTTNVDAATRRALMPPFVLQPLVENAIKHGLAPRNAPGCIEINGRVDGGWLRLCVRDNGVGVPRVPPVAALPGRGIGLRNVRERLRHLYGADHWFALTDAPGGGTSVELRIPYRTQGTPIPELRAVEPATNGAPAEPTVSTEPQPSPPLRARDWAQLAVGWLLFGVFWWAQPYLQILPYPEYDAVHELQQFSPLNIAIVLVWIALTPAVLWVARHVRVGIDGRPARALLLHFMAAIVFSAVQIEIIVLLDVQPRSFSFWDYPQAVMNVFVYAAIVAWSHGRDYYAWRRECELEGLQLEGALARARWRSLCANLRPDFVCDTLDVIAALIDDDVEQAERLNARLADLLRLTLETASEPWLPLSRELELLKAYSEVQRASAGRGLLRVRVLGEGEATHGARLVPNRLLRALLEDIAPASVEIEIGDVARGTRIAIASDVPVVDAAALARDTLTVEQLTVRVVDPRHVIFVIDGAARAVGVN